MTPLKPENNYSEKIIMPETEIPKVEVQLVNLTTPEQKKGFTKNQKIIASIAAIALALSISIGACVNSLKQKPKNPDTSDPSSTAEVTPTASPQEIFESKVDSYAPNMERYRVMDVDTFDKLPRDERLLYSQYITDQTVARGTYDGIYGKGSKNEASGTKTAPMSTSNTGQEIMNDYLYALQISYLQFVESEAKPFDAVDGQKTLSSVFYEVGKDGIVSNTYLSNVELQKTLTNIGTISEKFVATNTSELVSFRSSDGEQAQGKIVTYYDKDSITHYARFIYHEFTTYDGTRKSTWLFDVQAKTIEELSKY